MPGLVTDCIHLAQCFVSAVRLQTMRPIVDHRASAIDELASGLNAVVSGSRSSALHISVARYAFGDLVIQEVSPSDLHTLVRPKALGLLPFIVEHPWPQAIAAPGLIRLIIQELVTYGPDYRRSPVYNTILSKMDRGVHLAVKAKTRLSSRENVDIYFDRCLSLIDSVRRFGIHHHGKSTLPVDLPRLRSSRDDASDRYVQVAIGRRGEILRIGTGRHRTAIAQALRIESMPVEIVMIHADWVRKLVDHSGESPERALRSWLEACKLDGLAQGCAYGVRHRRHLRLRRLASSLSRPLRTIRKLALHGRVLLKFRY